MFLHTCGDLWSQRVCTWLLGGVVTSGNAPIERDVWRLAAPVFHFQLESLGEGVLVLEG